MLPTNVGDINIVHEKNWTHLATLCLIDLMRQRQSELFNVSASIEGVKKIEIWKTVADSMRQKGFTQTTNSVMKKFYNMRRTYYVIKKHRKSMNLTGESAKVGKGKRWPYYEAMIELMGDNDTSEIEESSTEETIRNLLEAGPEGLLQEVEGMNNSEPLAIRNEVNPQPLTIVIRTPRSINPSNNPGAPDVNPLYHHSIIQNSSSRVISSAEAETVGGSGGSNGASVVGPETVDINLPKTYPGNKTRNSPYRRVSARPSIAITHKRTRVNEELLVEEVQGMRQEIRGINRNLEKLVDVHNRLNDNLERFLTAVRIRID